MGLHSPKSTRPDVKGAYRNERLFSRLDADLKSKTVIWIGAPAGSGKTTLLSSYVSARGCPCLWFQLDGYDRDLATFFAGIDGAAHHLRSKRRRKKQHLDSEYATDVDAFAHHFFVSLYGSLPSGTVVVFDDAQWIDDFEHHDALLDGATRALTADKSLVFLSRHAPPQSLARLQSQQIMFCYGWPELKLNDREAAGLLSHIRASSTPGDEAERLNRIADGWAAGLVLLASHEERTQEALCHNIEDAPQVVFDYFTDELFRRLDPDQQSFLVGISVFPFVTPASAQKWTGNKDARGILERLCSKQCFVSSRGGKSPSFRIHPLFRDYLLYRLRLETDPEQLNEMYREAASILEKEKEVEAAAALLAESEDAEAMASFLRRQAASLSKSGRLETLARSLESLPDRVLHEDPWLVYWSGVCALLADTVKARLLFVPAYERFVAEGERRGAYLAWSRIVESYVYESGGYADLDEWLDAFEKLQQELGTPLSPEVFVRVSVSLFNALMFRRSDSATLRNVEKRMRRLMLIAPDVNARFMLGATLVRYYSWVGDIPGAESVMNRLRPQSDSPELGALCRIVWAALTASCGWLLESGAAGLRAARAGRELAAKTGIRLFDFHFLMQASYSAFVLGDLDEAAAIIDQMTHTFKPERRVDMGHCVFVRGWLEMAQGRKEKGLASMQEAMQVAESTGSPYIISRALHGLGQAQAENGMIERALATLDAADEIAIPHRFGPIVYLTELCRAELHLRRGDEANALAALRRGFQYGDKERYYTIPHWTPAQLATLCAKALEADVEPHYAKEIIRRQKLQCPACRSEVAQRWPWPVRVQALGVFQVWIDSRRLTFQGKAQGRPIDLLKLLIAFGAENVPAYRLAEMLWPDAEGDVARDALKTTVARLRKLIGKDGVEQTEGCLTLNPTRVWVDFLSVEKLLDELLRVEPSFEQAKAAVGAYSGDFLSSEPHAGWAIRPRERLRNKLVRVVEDTGRRLLETGHASEAAHLFASALDVCEATESLYAGLMKSQIALGQFCEAMRVFERYQRVLVDAFGLSPSPELLNMRAMLTNRSEGKASLSSSKKTG